MKKIYQEKDKLIFEYSSDNGLDWLLKELNKGCYTLNGFDFSNEDILDYNENTIKLLISNCYGDYYKINIRKDSFDNIVSFLIHRDITIKFSKICFGNSNVFCEMVNIIKDKNEIIIGGEQCDIIREDFIDLINNFPTPYEKKLYHLKKVQLVLKNYFENLEDYHQKYENYLSKKSFTNKTYINDINMIASLDIKKYEVILDSLKKNLKICDELSEADWKKYIAEIILILFPKYINYHKEAYIKLEKSNKKREFIDFILVKDNGAVDVLEVKKPDCNSIISNTLDRKNYYATNSLSMVVMQTEKYIYNLNRNVKINEDLFDSKYLSEYPKDFQFRIMNPKGIIIVGKSDNYNKQQLQDLEIIRRMYSNIVEIITYDDLIKMVERQIKMLKKRGNIC